MNTKSIVICGVGGQGIILASDVLCQALFLTGLDVKKNEIHGMSQREGSVLGFIRYGEKVESPVVSIAEADGLLSFEKLEGLRNLGYLKPGGMAVVNTQEILPTPVQMGVMEYPQNIPDAFAKVTDRAKFVDAGSVAREAGNAKAVNIVLLGVLSQAMPEVKTETWHEAMKAFVKPAFLEVNLKAFDIGRSL